MRIKHLLLVWALIWPGAEAFAGDEGVLRLGVLTELSGPGAAIAADCRNGLETGIAAFGNSEQPKIRLLYGDTQDDAATGVTEFKKLVQTGNAQVVLVTRSKTALPVNPVAKEMKIPLVGGVGHPDFLKGNPLAVRLFTSTVQEGGFLAAAAVEMKLKRLAIITLEDDWTLALSNSFKEALTKRGTTVVYDQHVLPADNDFATIALKVRQSAPDAIFVNVLLGQAGPLVKKLREAGVTQQILSNYWIQKEETVQTAGIEAVEGALFAQVDTEKPKFIKLLNTTAPGQAVTPGAYLCYAAIATVSQAAAAAGSRDASAFAAELIKDRTVRLLDDDLQYTGREAQLKLVLKTLKSGRPVAYQR